MREGVGCRSHSVRPKIGCKRVLQYGVAKVSRLLKIIGLFCRIQSFLQGSFAKETYVFGEPPNRSHCIVYCY